jgi:hypothetical protein
VRRKTTFKSYLCESEFRAEVSNKTRKGDELGLKATLVTEEPVLILREVPRFGLLDAPRSITFGSVERNFFFTFFP